jgi:hypothetical protein
MRSGVLAAIGAAVLFAGACSQADHHAVTSGGSAATLAPTSSASGSGGIDAAGFSSRVTNPWFPLAPGTTFVYAGVKDGKHLRDVFAVTTDTRVIAGVPCVVVDDRSYLDGHLSEKTSDYYSQDAAGDVWYFGEDTEELDAAGSVTSREGTWHAGENGATPGIFMSADPTAGESHRQELYRGHAEDQYRVVSLSSSISVPYGSFQGAVLTKEWTALEPGVLDHKFYSKDVGEVAEISVSGPTEYAKLVSVTHA